MNLPFFFTYKVFLCGGGGGHCMKSLGVVHTSHRVCKRKMGSKKASDASDEWLQIADHSWVQCPQPSVGKTISMWEATLPMGGG